MIQQQDFFIINVNNTTTLRKMVNTSLTLELKVNVEQLYTRRYARDRHDALPAASRNGPRAASGTARKCFRESCIMHTSESRKSIGTSRFAEPKHAPIKQPPKVTAPSPNFAYATRERNPARAAPPVGHPAAAARRRAASARPAEATARQRGNSHTRAGLGGESP